MVDCSGHFAIVSIFEFCGKRVKLFWYFDIIVLMQLTFYIYTLTKTKYKNGLINLLQAMMLDFKSYIKKLYGKYLVIERDILQTQGILLQFLKFD